MVDPNDKILNISVKPNARLTLTDVERIPASLPCLMGWKDRSSRYLGISDHQIDFCGLESRETFMGKKDHEIERFIPLADHYLQCDRFAMNEQPFILTEKVINSKNEFITVKTIKYPLYNFALDKVIGVFFMALPLEDPLQSSKTNLSLFSNQTSPILLSSSHYVFYFSKSNIALSERESSVLYYYLRGRTSKQIANTLNLSHRTIEDSITKIKFKLDLQSRSDVVDLVISQGLFDFVPYSILK